MTAQEPSPSQPELIRTADGVNLALRLVGPADGVPIVLTHGTFSNHRSCLGLANYLAGQGFACWLFEWRGHGDSGRNGFIHSFDDVAEQDVPAILDAVSQRSGQTALHWIGHSGGGLIVTMWAARNPELAQRRLRSMVLIGSQATAAGASLSHRLAVLGYDWLLRWRRVAPSRAKSVGPEAESALLMRQWSQWNLRRRFDSLAGFDYLAGLANVDLPVLGVAGSGDTFIAPVAGCEALVKAFGGNDARLELFGLATGAREDYSHNRLLLSRNASQEIWPRIADWLKRH
ncbi:alpha/beta fold hydrolase [Pseudomonas nitroreducens]|uniref:alpha/beta fold hydrolase n=1 Tax=Pseudomonas nitroreducens TaxID=46680 RepID=UPI002657FA66|nr:alpha/beta fold hydrolase [Pseudomonas nitroreducens]MCP1651890.1 oxygen-independent coproporphyrinogen-3 oxidase [Pseudomonas nitroreducens]MCP1689373.1 oxygen-independent coproporphyrinogen-3 oxidase [Pseudomonas nitroreducens]